MKIRLLEINNLSFSFGDIQVLSNISLKIENGEWVQIKGFNGEGKTTLIKSILQLYPYSGEILLKGKDIKDYSIKELSKIFSYVPQRLDNIPNLTVGDFLSLYDDKDKKEIIIRKLGLQNIILIPLIDLSLGQLQLVLLSQALLTDPEILILDEPTSSLDIENKNKIFSFIKEFVSSGKTVITVNHDLNTSYTPHKIFTLSNTHLYDTNVIIEQKQYKKQYDPIATPKYKIFLILLIITILLSFFIPSFSSYLLRVLWLVISGGVFSFTGLVFQNLFRNSLSSPNTLGISSWSLLGLVLSLILGITTSFYSSLLAILFGLVSVGLFIPIFRRKIIKDRSFPLLYGISQVALLFPIILSLFSLVDPSVLNNDIRRIIGDFNISDYSTLFLLPISFLLIIPIYVYSNSLTSMSIDADLSQVNGTSCSLIRNMSLILSTIAISILVSQVGLLPFVGLVIPNIIVRLYGVNLKSTLPVSFLLGSLFVLFCDIILRLLEYYTVLPLTTGMITCVLGSFLLILVLLRKKEW